MKIKKWYWVGFGCWGGVSYGPYRSKKKAEKAAIAGKSQFRLVKK